MDTVGVEDEDEARLITVAIAAADGVDCCAGIEDVDNNIEDVADRGGNEEMNASSINVQGIDMSIQWCVINRMIIACISLCNSNVIC